MYSNAMVLMGLPDNNNRNRSEVITDGADTRVGRMFVGSFNFDRGIEKIAFKGEPHTDSSGKESLRWRGINDGK